MMRLLQHPKIRQSVQARLLQQSEVRAHGVAAHPRVDTHSNPRFQEFRPMNPERNLLAAMLPALRRNCDHFRGETRKVIQKYEAAMVLR